MEKIFSDVKRFMTACGQGEVGNQATIDLYKKLIVEEYNEFIQADETDNEVKRLDGCFDMMWVIIGYMLAKGWDCDAAWDEGSFSNLAKIDPTTGTVIKRASDGKVQKPSGWKEPNFEQFV